MSTPKHSKRILEKHGVVIDENQNDNFNFHGETAALRLTLLKFDDILPDEEEYKQSFKDETAYIVTTFGDKSEISRAHGTLQDCIQQSLPCYT